MLQSRIRPLSPKKLRFKDLDAPVVHPLEPRGELTSLTPARRYKKCLCKIWIDLVEPCQRRDRTDKSIFLQNRISFKISLRVHRIDPVTSSGPLNLGVLSKFAFMLQPRIRPLSPLKSRFKVSDGPGDHQNPVFKFHILPQGSPPGAPRDPEAQSEGPQGGGGG